MYQYHVPPKFFFGERTTGTGGLGSYGPGGPKKLKNALQPVLVRRFSFSEKVLNPGIFSFSLVVVFVRSKGGGSNSVHKPILACRTSPEAVQTQYGAMLRLSISVTLSASYHGSQNYDINNLGSLIFIHLQCWEVLPFLAVQR